MTGSEYQNALLAQNNYLHIVPEDFENTAQEADIGQYDQEYLNQQLEVPSMRETQKKDKLRLL